MKLRISSEALKQWAFLILGGLLFAVLGARLFHLQVLHWPEYREQSDNNRYRLIQIAPPRGVMRDRLGRLLVTNRPAYSLYGVPRELWRDPRAMQLLGAALQMPPGFLENQVIAPYRRTFAPMRLERDLSFAQLSAFEEVRDQISGAFLEVEQKRAYPNKLVAHALGYVSEVAKEELDKFTGVTTGDLVGKRGLERIYDEQIRGKKGTRFSVVNALGQEVGEQSGLERIEPEPGHELWLTLDLEAQALAESLMVGKSGAIVALDPKTGGVLVLASAPTYDPEVFAGRVSAADWDRLMEDPLKPMLNRAVQAGYPPGSTIKPAMLLEGLESQTITPRWSTSCPGSYTVGNRTFKCWKKGGHGHVEPLRAVEASCDVFFYKLGMQMGVDGVHRALTRVGLGSVTGIDQTSEAPGIVPSEAYYNKRYGPSGWTKGFIPSISIGQGEVLATPLQLAVYAAAMADGQFRRRPHLVRGVFDPDARVLHELPVADPIPLNVRPENMALVQESMVRVVWGDAGTAGRQRDEQVRIAGKTGTSQNPHGDDHALFIGYAPIEDPIIAICVVVEFGEHGSSGAAPLAKEIMKRYVLSVRPASEDVAFAQAGQ